MSSDAYKLYKKHEVEIFEIFEDILIRSPKTPIFGFETKEEEDAFDKMIDQYWEEEEPKIKEKLRIMGFDVK